MNRIQIFQEALKTAMFGMTLVLGTLFLLSFILDSFRVIFAPKTKTPEPAKEEIKEPKVNVDAEDDLELIAVITAALSAYLEKDIYDIKVNSIRQIHAKTPAWGAFSRKRQVSNKL